MQTLSETARWFSDQLSRSHHFEVISDGSQIPVVAFRLAGGPADSAGGPDGGPGFNEFDVSTSLRSYGWQVPAYTMPDGAEDVTVLRVVVREGFSADLARSLWADLQAVIAHLGEIKPGGYFTQEHFAH
jgi:glutamate decarboxylase